MSVAFTHQQSSARFAEQLGLEMEMVVADLAGRTHRVEGFFQALQILKSSRGLAPKLKRQSGHDVAVIAPLVNSSLDNAFNNLESALGPVAGGAGGLARLHALAHQELADVMEALAQEGATLLNFSEHPDVRIDPAFYVRMRAPKPIYDYWVGVRGWDHSVGVDAKAQNGPTTSVPIAAAVDALNVVLALAPAFIAIFANSPFESGDLTGLKENRLTIWPRMFRNARFTGDLRLQQLPARPFRDLRDYFQWMFGPGTVMQAVPAAPGADYKGAADAVEIEGDPCALAFLRGGRCRARSAGGIVEVEPTLRHLEFLQFSHFLDGRIRYGFARVPSPAEFFAAWERAGGLEDLFAEAAGYSYLEGRAAGANFPDADLLETADGDTVASCVIAASAMQAGLLKNLAGAQRIVARWGWDRLRALRPVAIASALDGEDDGLRIRDLCREVLDAAAEGLAADERWMLAYPRHVCATGLTGADRAIALWDKLADPARDIGEVIRRRMVVTPGVLHPDVFSPLPRYAA